MDDVISIRCYGCGTEKSIDDYAKNSSRSNGRQGYCKTCMNEARNRSRTKNRCREGVLYPETKICKKCGLDKSYIEFSKATGEKDGLFDLCKKCDSLSRTEHRRANKERGVIEFPTVKGCQICKKTLPAIRFSKNSREDDGLDTICKVCFSARSKARRDSRKERKVDDIQFPDRKVCSKCNVEKPPSSFCVSLRENDGLGYVCKECVRNEDLIREYGVDLVWYKNTIIEQGGCAICGKGENGGRRLHVDHDHTTGKTRGVLCFRCNSMLGFSQDSIETFQKAIDYLNKHKEAK